MLSLAKSETPDSSGYFQMSQANWGNPSQWPFERLKVRCFITGIVFKKMTVRGERRIMSRAFSITATKERGGENIVKKNMSFSKWARGGGEGNNMAFSCGFIRFPLAGSASALGRNNLTLNTVALYYLALLQSKK